MDLNFMYKAGERMQAIAPEHYYKNRFIRDRIADYCGGGCYNPESFTAEYIAGFSEHHNPERISEDYYISICKDSFSSMLDKGVDIFRSVWDRSATLGILDIEYFNLNYPAEAYFNPRRTFGLLESVTRKISRILNTYRIPFLQLMTGQGYHFVFKVNFAGPVHRKLVKLAVLEDSLETKYLKPQGRLTRAVPLDAALAFEGMGRLMEYVANQLIHDFVKIPGPVPVVCTDLSVGKNKEAISVDLSMYADPLYMRDTRCPFSTYQKHIYLRSKFGARVAAEVPVFATLPKLRSYNYDDLIKMRSNAQACEDYAKKITTRIPEASEGISELIKSYYASKLYKFHTYFYSSSQDKPETWHFTYDKLNLDSLPACVAESLRVPNDNLLKPTNLQTLTRVLLSKGWHPRHIAGLVRSKLERDESLARQWRKYDAASRASFYVRLFSGLVSTGADTREDLNCFSHEEKRYCWQKQCGHNLMDYR